MYAKFDKVVALLESVSIPIMTGTEKANGTWVFLERDMSDSSYPIGFYTFFLNFHQNEEK